ncbi:MAG: NTP transferase domain-containing protein [Hyphomicrobiales bacterium]
MTVAGVLLAAGSSRRFGATDKLLAMLQGRPLVTHAAQAMCAFDPDVLIAVTTSPEVAALLPDFEIAAPPEEAPEQSDSLRAGISLAESRGATRIVIALADMPFVTADLLQKVAGRCTATRASAATDGQRTTPPACFPQSCFSDLRDLRGDRGAAALLRDLPPSALVDVPPETLRDIDTPDLLRAAQSDVDRY